jgi:peptidoglycan biosynthesis protein MviN/MurJ (putative lipid II flippase)
LIFSIILINYFDNEGLALATSIARFFGFILIAFDVRREVEISISDLISKSSVKIIVLLLLMIIYFVGILKILPPSLDYGFIIGLIRISLIFGSGALLYLIMGYLINIEETRYLVGLLTKKILTKRE